MVEDDPEVEENDALRSEYGGEGGARGIIATVAMIAVVLPDRVGYRGTPSAYLL